MQNLSGSPEVLKALGFAASGVFRGQLTYTAIAHFGGVSMNPLYPTYMSCKNSLGVLSV